MKRFWCWTALLSLTNAANNLLSSTTSKSSAANSITIPTVNMANMAYRRSNCMVQVAAPEVLIYCSSDNYFGVYDISSMITASNTTGIPVNKQMILQSGIQSAVKSNPNYSFAFSQLNNQLVVGFFNPYLKA